MKLAYLCNSRLPTEKAYGIQIAKMCEAFALQSMETTLIYPFRKNRIKEDIFSYYALRHNFNTKEIRSSDFYWPGFLDKMSFIIKNYFSARALANEALKENADIYYTRDELAAYFLSKRNKNVVFECHKFLNKKKVFYSYFIKTGLKIVTISDGLKRDLVKFGIKDSNILVAPDGVDLEKFNTEISQEEARLKIGLPLNKKIVVYNGHFFEWKGVYTLLEAARLCRNVLFVFVGGTSKDIEVFKKNAKNMENVMIVGHRPYREMPIFLRSADVLVLPNSAKEEISRSYTSPLKLFEYMASGRPIVASNLPSIGEVLNEDNSLLVASDNPESLSGGIIKVLENDVLSYKIAAQGLEDVKKYSWQERSKKIWTYLGF